MIAKINSELEFYKGLRDFCLSMCKEAQDRGQYDDVSDKNYYACNAVVNALERLLK